MTENGSPIGESDILEVIGYGLVLAGQVNTCAWGACMHLGQPVQIYAVAFLPYLCFFEFSETQRMK